MSIFSVNDFIKVLFFAGLCSIGFTACHSDSVYEQVVDLPSLGWADTTTVKFDFNITNAVSPKNVFLTTRYNNQYSFYNLYLQYTLCDSAGRELVKKLDQVILFDETKGIPLGNGFAGTTDLEVKMYYLKKYTFPYPGRYTLYFKQFMRITPLQGIKAIGIKVKNLDSAP